MFSCSLLRRFSLWKLDVRASVDMKKLGMAHLRVAPLSCVSFISHFFIFFLLKKCFSFLSFKYFSFITWRFPRWRALAIPVSVAQASGGHGLHGDETKRRNKRDKPSEGSTRMCLEPCRCMVNEQLCESRMWHSWHSMSDAQHFTSVVFPCVRDTQLSPTSTKGKCRCFTCRDTRGTPRVPDNPTS